MNILRSVLIVMALAVESASAASLFVRPTTVILAQGNSAAIVTLTNSGTAPVTAQLRTFAWDQSGNEDQLTATTAIVASPPMMTIAAGQSQTVRLVRVAKSRASREESYRLLVDEIPDRAAGDAGSNVQIQLRYSVPVFVIPNPKSLAKLSVTAEVSDTVLVFDAVNSGKSHAQISNVVLGYADGSSHVVGQGLVGYVLPDKNRQWKLALPEDLAARGKPQQVRATVNGKEMAVTL
ncbi:fimbrial chaperone protein [Povalibacter uvarum]|uniref:Fimbrial chaperone protein n=1 Tax=Povalibacter uvarum TaxID=732238 RepID=A0A841HVR5_9GAMM|nr:molecular chaperone [Povalibacter uvarum]MBB6096290.1 fimbrial chaperone protein [Povalibacter uvarum]